MSCLIDARLRSPHNRASFRWMGNEFLGSLRAGTGMAVAKPRLSMIYPTVEAVRVSFEGWAGGGAIPHASK